MQVPVPAGLPMRLPAEVAGSLSRLQGLLQAAHPQIQNAYAMHWLALRQAGAVPEFQPFTQQMLWGAYGTLALGGLLHHALSSRATPEVMGGIIDQLSLLQEQYGRAAQSLQEFLQRPEARDFAAVPPMMAALRPVEQFVQGMQAPAEAVMTGLRWSPGPMLDMPLMRRADIERPRAVM